MVEIQKKFTVVKNKVHPVVVFLRKNDLLTAEAFFNIGLLIYGIIAINFLNMKNVDGDIQIIVTFPLLFFVPGYAITQLSFYENTNKIEILAMSIAISLAMIPLFVYLDVARTTIIPNTKWNEELAIVALVLLTLLILLRHIGTVILETIGKLRSKTP